MSRSASFVSISSSIGNGGVSEREKISSTSALTSISPVAIFGLTLSPRDRTVPTTPMQNSLRRSPARAWAATLT